jgi:UDP-2-acetamido-3-amino-2,3-dideoxy-glucuronate N-acetyltransferase
VTAPQVHPTAIIDSGAVVGEDTRIWHFVHVTSAARIGARCSIGQGCYIGNVAIGDGCRIQNHVSVFDGVELGEDVFVGPAAAFTNVTNPRAHVSRSAAFTPTRVERGATIGANATIRCGVTIGAFAMVGAGAVVTRDVEAHAIVVGTPARRIGWACRCGESLPASRTCRACGERFAQLK